MKDILTAIENALDAPTTQNIGQRRKSSTADILVMIDNALQNSPLPADAASSTPTTVQFINELDELDGSGPMGPYGGRIKQFPPQIFSRYDPEETIYGSVLRHDFGKLISFRPETLAALIASAAGHMDTEILTAEEIATLRDLQRKFSAISPQLAKFSNLAAADEFHNQASRRVSETLTTGALPSASIRTHESIIAEFSANRRALNELQLEISHKCYPLVLKAYSRVFEIIRATMMRLEAGERETAKNFHIPWAPSYLWKACAGIQIRLHPSRLADNVPDQIAPRSLLLGIVEL